MTKTHTLTKEKKTALRVEIEEELCEVVDTSPRDLEGSEMYLKAAQNLYCKKFKLHNQVQTQESKYTMLWCLQRISDAQLCVQRCVQCAKAEQELYDYLI